MRLIFQRLTAILTPLAFATVFIVFTGCQTPPTEPTFQDYDPAQWSPPGETNTPSETEPEPAPVTEPEPLAPMEESAVFGVGDLVFVIVTGVSSEEIRPHQEGIKDDGTINLYLVGKVKAAGKTAGNLQRELQERYEVYFKNPVVTVQAADRFYYVGGEVKRPAAQNYLGKTTVTKAIQAAGDFTDFAKKNKIKVTRADGTSLRVNFNKALDDPSLDPPIYPGDTIHVPRRILW